MRTGRDLILATRPFAADNPARSWFYAISTALLLAAAFSGTIWAGHPVAKAVCSVFSGLLMLRLFVIYHDQQHHAILSKSRVAEGLMQVYGIFSLSPSSIWRSSHNYHHKHNSRLRSAHIGSFPIMTGAEFRRSSRGARFRYLFQRHPLTLLFGYLFVFLHGMCLYPFVTKPRAHYDCLMALLVHFGVAIAITVHLGLMGLVFTLLLPFFIACAFGTYLFYAQHNFPGVTFYDRAGWAYEKAALESSSFLKTGPILRWFTANIGFHHIHHLNARIPFYRLPEARAALPELNTPKTTSLRPSDILACLRLKLWDVDTQKMITVRQCLEAPVKAVAPPAAPVPMA
jgi:omega-6 fatty acid desaturase (delta-12 desaturase)